MLLSLEMADRLCRTAVANAAAAGALISVAVVDAGGHLVAFRRMDGAEIAGPIIAPDKAFTAVANRISTAELGRLAQPGGELYGYSSAANGRFIAFGGGIPLFAGSDAAGSNAVGTDPARSNAAGASAVGAVGVSGATAAQDHAFADAAASLWTELTGAGQAGEDTG
ncbi:MAG: hypothetical protein QOE71_592 [Pseudonocardiales bacterium]|jgi:uncharacterized protein GlcG (DUF336 family)|nr:hypothetical protein [Pseudonocardiales bacterium]MDQ1749536.1 hypothetical protein [Pseudonocardiales bacterium]